MMPQQHGAVNAHPPSIPLYVNGRRVYTVEGDVLRKQFSNHHILQRPRGIAADIAILDEAANLGASRLEFRHRETGQIYRTTMQMMREFGVYLDRGYGAQKVLPAEYWSIDGMPPQRRPAAIVEAEKAAERAKEPQQLGLFAS